MASDGDDEHEKTITPKSLSMSFDGSFWGMKPLFGDKSTGNSNGDMLDVDNETSFDPDADGASLFDPDAILKSSINTTLKGDCGISIKGTSLDVPASNAESSDLPSQLVSSSPYQQLEANTSNIISQHLSGTLIDTFPPRARTSSVMGDQLIQRYRLMTEIQLSHPAAAETLSLQTNSTNKSQKPPPVSCRRTTAKTVSTTSIKWMLMRVYSCRVTPSQRLAPRVSLAKF